MKNLAAFVDQADIYRHIDGLWRTEEFRERAETDGFIRRLVDEFSRSPRFFADMTAIVSSFPEMFPFSEKRRSKN